MIDFGRDICGNLPTAERREWLVTNGIGGYAMGTVAQIPTRRYHGLLVAALQPPVGRTLLLTKLDETATYDGQFYQLFASRRMPRPRGPTSHAGAKVEPAGFQHLERFRLEGTTPVWTFACADALLEKRVWMQHGANTTLVGYDLVRASGPLALTIGVLVNYRDHHSNTHAGEWRMQIEPMEHGLRIRACAGATPLHLLSDQARATPQHEWLRDGFLAVEAFRGLDPLDDNLCAGHFEVTLQQGQALTLLASTEEVPCRDGMSALAEQRERERCLLARARLAPRPLLSASAGTAPSAAAGREPGGSATLMDEALGHLVLAADQFIVRRPLPDDPEGRSVIAGYPWFSDWGRDTMIALSGLTLATGRPEVAQRILHTFARFVSQGMLPNRFPDEGQAPEYNTVDATLWYFEAIRAYHEATGDATLLQNLFPVLADIIDWHVRGTRYQIHVDPADGLLYAGEPGVQLTWMDAKVDDWVVTPRIGKAVEINALWYHALRVMAEFARHLGEVAGRYEELADRAQAGFARFWSAARGHCYDVIDGPGGNEAALRPNQLLAVSLHHSPLTSKQQKAVVDVCARCLLTSHGLRSLAPDDAGFIGHYRGDQRTRDAAYHQGTVWGWLIGPFASAHLRVYGDPERTETFLRPLLQQLADHGLGSISEIFDGDPPFTPRGCIAQAWSVAEVLRVWKESEVLRSSRISRPVGDEGKGLRCTC
jgi:glycogen debranching enzyme